MTGVENICIVGLLTCYPFFAMNPERNELASLATLIELSCAPMFKKIQSAIGASINSDEIIAFAKRNGRKNESVQLATHICGILLEGIRAAQNDYTCIHTSKSVREKIAHVMPAPPIQSENLIALYEEFDLPLYLKHDLLVLAKQFLEQL